MDDEDWARSAVTIRREVEAAMRGDGVRFIHVRPAAGEVPRVEVEGPSMSMAYNGPDWYRLLSVVGYALDAAATPITFDAAGDGWPAVDR